MVLATALGVALIAAGCGDDDENGSASASGDGLATSSLGKAEYVKQASAACVKERDNLLAKVNAYLEKHDSKNADEGVVLAGMYKAVVLPTVEAEIAAVRKLGAPEGDEDEIEAILAAQQKAVDEARQIKSAKTLEELEDPFMPASKMYRDYGFTACTNSP